MTELGTSPRPAPRYDGPEQAAARFRPSSRPTMEDTFAWRCACGRVLLCAAALDAHQLDHEAMEV